MDDTVELSAVRFAELVAPAISRTFVAGIRAAGDDGRALLASYGGPEAVGYLVDLRNPLAAGRAVPPDGLAEHYRYADPDKRHETVQNSIAQGLLERIKPAEINARFVAYREALRLPDVASPHSLRHSYVTHLTEDGVDRRFIQEQVGHRCDTSTAIYTHVSGDFMNTALRKALGPAFEPGPDGGREPE